MDPFPELDDDPYVQQCLSKYHTYHFEYVPGFVNGFILQTKQQLPVLFYVDFCDNFPSTIQLLDPKGNVLVVSVKENKGRPFMRYGSTRIGEVYNLFFGGWITLYFAHSTTFHMQVRDRMGKEVKYHSPSQRYGLEEYGFPVPTAGVDKFLLIDAVHFHRFWCVIIGFPYSLLVTPSFFVFYPFCKKTDYLFFFLFTVLSFWLLSRCFCFRVFLHCFCEFSWEEVEMQD